MRKLIRWLAKRAGVSTTYHVAALYQQDSYVSSSTLAMTVTILPWLHSDNYRELMEYVHTKAINPTPAMPTITSITKLGI